MEIELIEKAATEIAEYSKTEAGLAALRERMEGVAYDLTTTKGMTIAKADRAEVRGLRTGLEATRKAIKAPALAHCKLIDDEAKRITAALLELEEPIDQQIKARETEIEEARLAKEAAERDRINGIKRRIDDLRIFATNASKCRTSAAIQTLIDNLAAIEMTGFEEFEDEAKFVRKSTMEAMEVVLLDKQAEEAERAQQAAAAAKLAEEQAAAAAQLKKEREELEAARKAQEAETARNRAAAISEADRLATESQRQADEAAAQRKAEQDAIDAQRAKEQEELNKQRAELAAQQAAFEAQQAALAPVVVSPVAIETVAPVFAPEQAAEVPVLTGEMVVVPVQSNRPTDRAMLAAIAEQFCVTDRQAFDWIYTFDFDGLNDLLIDEERAL